MNYKFGAKNNWRRTIWNRIVEHLTVPPREAVVLYLAGEQDLDRPIAKSKGFKEYNLIAIDRESDVICSLRKSKKLAVNATLSNVVFSWCGQRVAAVFADYCCGFSTEVAYLLKWIMINPCFCDSVIGVNLLRGRDAWKNDSVNSMIHDIKHRGKIASVVALSGIKLVLESIPDINHAEVETIFDKYHEFIGGAVLGSYRSTSGQIFDSAVWRNLSLYGFYTYMREFYLDRSQVMPIATPELENDCPYKWKPKAADSETFNKLLAIRATRTRYINAA